MQDWNVVVSVHERGYSQARALLESYGEVAETEFFNVLAMKVDDIHGFLSRIDQLVQQDPGVLKLIARIVPVTLTFGFQSPEEFEIRSRGAVVGWLGDLAGKTFHVRMHRRGFKGRLSSQEEERFLDQFLMKCLDERGFESWITFDDPDVVIALETLGQRAGLSFWRREDRMQHALLKLD